MVTLTPVAKYGDVDDVRKHSEYTPAAAPLALTDSITLVADTNDEATLVATLVGEPLLHAVDDTTNADPSLLTSNRPAPLTSIAAAEALASITLGVSDVTLTTFSPPASTYDNEGDHRAHTRYTPAAALESTSTCSTITDPDPLLEHDVPLTTVGLELFGAEHDTASTNADTSPLTSGIDKPPTATT